MYGRSSHKATGRVITNITAESNLATIASLRTVGRTVRRYVHELLQICTRPFAPTGGCALYRRAPDAALQYSAFFRALIGYTRFPGRVVFWPWRAQMLLGGTTLE